ncbi:uncharacterized protein JCM15063_003060 [Sporobolomyces koalae]|uniref:uncharacterized protein n=1 Tax=Sporobolomyces koalae TaxID=500713 RepID=UPI003171C053
MLDPLIAFLDLSKDKRTSPEAIPALSQLLQALSQGQEPTTDQRRKLLSAFLGSASPGSGSELQPSTQLSLLATSIKLLGRDPAGSEELAREDGIKVLLELGGLRRIADLPRNASNSLHDLPEGEDDDTETLAKRAIERREQDPLRQHEAEALRCLCNVLMLQPSSRDVFASVALSEDKRTVMKGLLRILGCEGAGFLAGRLLFMLTSKPTEAVSELVLEGDIVEILRDYSARFLTISKSKTLGSQNSSGTMPTSEDVLREHLKLAYTVMLYFDRSRDLGRRGSQDDGAQKKKKRFWRSRQSSASSESGAAAEEAAQEASTKSTLRRAVDAVKLNSGSSSSASNAGSTLAPPPREEASSEALSLTSARHFLPIFKPYLEIAVTSPLFVAGGPSAELADLNPTVKSAMNALLNFPVEIEEIDGSEYSWIQYVPTRTDKNGIVLKAGGFGSLGERLLSLLQQTCDTHFPVDVAPPASNSFSSTLANKPPSLPAGPDDWITTGQGEATKLEEILAPVMLLLRKLSMVGEANEMFHFVLFPPTMDRSKPVNRHSTLTGHLVRIMSSVFLPNTAFGVGEFLYNLAERSPDKLCTLIGYGNASGFLQSRGELIPPPPPADSVNNEETDTFDRTINPITGAFDPPPDPNAVEMTEEEKEQEAEKLYTLFDRMSRTGVMNVENPIDKARQEGRFEETSEQREKELERLQREEDEIEKEVERDMANWRAKRDKSRPLAGEGSR